MSKNSKLILGVVIIITLFLGAYLFYRDQKFENITDPDKELQGEEYNKYWEWVDGEYQKDMYGGDTPEETLNLFIRALEAKDYELASKYFVAEKQSAKLNDFKKANEQYFILTIDDIEKSLKNQPVLIDEGFVRYRTYDENGIAEFSFDLIENTYSNKWKIYEL